MSTDPTESLEALRRTNRALAERVAELERQLKRYAGGDARTTPLGVTLAEREALLSEAERIVHCGSWVWDVVTNEVLWSDELYRIMGCDPATDAASLERFFECVHPDDRERVQTVSRRVVSSGVNERIEYRVLRRDGTIRHVATDAALLYDADGKLQRAVGTVLDVTETRASAETIERTAELLGEAQRIGKMGSFALNVVHQTLDWSDELFRVMDIDRNEPPSLEAFVERLHPDDRAHIALLMERSTQFGETQPSRARIVHRDGSIRHVEMMAIATRDDHGRVLAVRGTVADVTDLVKLEAQFHQSQKMEAVGQLAGGLAHDYNNLLMVIRGNAELLLDRSDAPELREILAATSSAAGLTNRLLTFSRRNPHRARVARLGDDLEEAKGLIQRAVGDRIRTCYAIDEDTWPVHVDRAQVHQVLLNLVLNARDAMPDGGTLSLTVRNATLSTAAALQRHERAGDYVTLTVADTGIGMDETTRARAFEPFFTTKPVGHGTGLGLAMVFGAMKQCGGFVEVESQPQVGTTFRLWFPRTLGEPVPSARSDEPPPRANAHILLVEDNRAVAAVAKRILEGAGYLVRTCDNPIDAPALWRAEPADVLVTDVEMPGLSGIELRELIAATTPGLRTVFITGHPTELLDVSLHEGTSRVVLKPFRRNDLLFTLAQLLGTR